MVIWEERMKLLEKFTSSSGEVKVIDVELFTWEKLDYVNKIKEKLNI